MRLSALLLWPLWGRLSAPRGPQAPSAGSLRPRSGSPIPLWLWAGGSHIRWEPWGETPVPKLRRLQKVPGHSPLLLLPFVRRGAGRGNAQSVTEAKMAACCSLERKHLPEAFPAPAPPFLSRQITIPNKPRLAPNQHQEESGAQDPICRGTPAHGA